VKQALHACYEWAQLIEKKIPPADLLKNLKAKENLLSDAISRESLRFAAETKQELDFNTFLTDVQVKKPMEYYDDGKVHIAKKNWNDAKDCFLRYQKFADAGQKGYLPASYKIKVPTADRHLEYLEYIQKQLNLVLHQATGEEEMILSKMAPQYVNPYTEPKVAWRERYPYKEE